MKDEITGKSGRQLMKQFGTSYFWATLLLPKKIQSKTVEFYKYVRIADEIVDNPSLSISEKEESLTDLHNQRKYIYNHRLFAHPVMGNWLQIMMSENISDIYIDAFWQSMFDDLKVNRYETYEQLQGYMYGSAEVVGLVMCDIIGYDETHREETLTGARKLGEAMQLTNFLRDVAEDYVELGRIYMPSEDLAKFGLDHRDILTFCDSSEIDNRRIDFVKYMIAKCDKMYDEANETIKYLSADSRDAVYISSHLYRAILRKIESIGYNQFAHSARTSRWDKFLVIAKEQLICKYIISCLS